MTKPELRRRMRQVLAALTPSQRHESSQRIAEAVWTVAEVAAARTILLFAGRADEVETDLIAEGCARMGITTVYPRIHDAPGIMTLHRVEPAALRPGTHRIREPDAAAPRVGIDEVDVALVPGMAWDRAGGRLGRGGGYFDRLFADPAWRGFRCGLFFACQEVESVPADPWDARLDVIVTESGAWRPAALSGA